MNAESALYITQLKTALCSPHSNVIIKKWALLWLREIEYQSKLAVQSRETLDRLNGIRTSNVPNMEKIAALPLPG